MQKIHIGSEIKARMESRGMNPAEIARRLKRTSQSLYHIFDKASIDTELLQRIGSVLEFDFFTLYVSEKEGVETKPKNKKKISLLIDIEDPDQQKAILKIAGVTLK